MITSESRSKNTMKTSYVGNGVDLYGISLVWSSGVSLLTSSPDPVLCMGHLWATEGNFCVMRDTPGKKRYEQLSAGGVEATGFLVYP
jgi:hypothetical protein